MQIFIDESGIFAGQGDKALSVVGVLCIPDKSLPKITGKYLKIRSQLQLGGGEVKGKNLTEKDVNRVIEILRRNEAIFEASVIDVSAHNHAAVLEYRDALAAYMESTLERFNTEGQKEVRETIGQLRRMPLNPFLQAMATVDVLESVLAHIPLYFSQRDGRELGTFKWIVDAKNHAGTTDWERWLSTYCPRVLAARSKTNPGGRLEGGDYTHFSKFEAPTQDGTPATDLQLLFADIHFSAAPEPGLELVDIVTTALRRALVGHLREDGWQDLRRLMIHRPDRHYISLMRLDGASSMPIEPKYAEVVRKFTRDGRLMIAPRFLALAKKACR